MKPFIISIFLLCSAATSFAQNQSDTTIIKQLILQYAQSINDADTTLGSKLFSHAPEVSFIQPRGHQHGWEEIKQQIYGFFHDAFTTRQLNIVTEHITMYGDVAWAEFYWVFNATFKNNNQSIQTKGRETQIWRKANNQWHLVHVHYSNMPVTEQGQGL